MLLLISYLICYYNEHIFFCSMRYRNKIFIHAQHKLLHVENAMSRPLELVGPPAYTLHKSMVVIIILNIVLGVSGYLRYGDRCTGSVSLNLPPNNKLVYYKINFIMTIVACNVHCFRRF